MAHAGTDVQRWRNSPALLESDDVQRSIELLDKVLSEYSDEYSGNVTGLEGMEINAVECETDMQPAAMQGAEAANEEHVQNSNFLNDDDDDKDDDDDDADADDDDDIDDDGDDDDDDNDGDDEEEQLTNYSDIDLPTDSKHFNAANFDVSFPRRRKKKKKDGVLDRGVSESESDKFSIPRSSSVSIERFSIRANYDSSDFSRANSMSNEKFHSDFSLAVASASSGDCVSIPTSDPFSVRNLDFAASAFSLGRANSYSEKFSDIYSTRNSDFSTRNSTDFRTTQSEEEEKFSDDSLEEIPRSTPSLTTPLSALAASVNTPVTSSSSTTATSAGISQTVASPSTTIFLAPCSTSTVSESKSPIAKRHSIAWDVPFEQNSLYAPGSTKVVGRRRRRSSDVSSVDSTCKLQDIDYDWPDYDYCHRSDNDNAKSSYSVANSTSSNNNNNNMHSNNNNNSDNNKLNELMSFKQDFVMKNDDTYIIRGRTRKKKHVSKRFSNTFDDIKCLLREGKLEGLNEPPPDFVPSPPVPPDLVRVLSLPTFSDKQVQVSEPISDYRQNATFELSSNSRLKHNKKKSKRTQHIKINSNSLPVSNSNSDITSTSNAPKTSPSMLAKKKFESCGNFTKLDRAVMTDESSIQTKIPVNVLIEDQIVKKALNENRRQLEKVSDALKELENVRNDTLLQREKELLKKELNNLEIKVRNSIDDVDYGVNNVDKFSYEGDNTSPESRHSSFKPNDSIRRNLHNTADVKTYDNQIPESSLTDNNLQIVENAIDTILENSKNSLFQVNVEILEFPPLPPSPVEEADEENCDFTNTADNVNNFAYNGIASATTSASRHVAPSRIPEYKPRVPPHRVPLSSITNVKDDKSSCDANKANIAGRNNGKRIPAMSSNSRQDYILSERCTLSTELPGPSSRTRSNRCVPTKSSPADNSIDTFIDKKTIPPSTITGMQTSCSLPETPVFARGCDASSRIPEHVSNASSTMSMITAAKGATTTSATSSVASTTTTASTTKISSNTSDAAQIRRQPSWYGPTISTTGGYRRNNPGLEEAILGTELLRLAGGPSRGWYPTRRSTKTAANQPRPASIEHLERLNNAYESRLSGNAYSGEFLQRKPLTLPTNIRPNKFFGQQSKHSTATSGTREALRRVTSLLIKKGVGVKGDMKGGGSGKDVFFSGSGNSSGTGGGPYSGCESATGNDGPKKKGFFKNFWKRSRHYSLENQ